MSGSPVNSSKSHGKVTAAALLHLAQVLGETAQRLEDLTGRAIALSQNCAGDAPLSSVMAAEERPLIVTQVTQILDRLADAGAAVRRAEARQLRAEGLTQEQIAVLFGVTRQRAAALLAPPPAVHARAAKRPRAEGAAGTS